MYNISNCPNLKCCQCKFFNIKADLDGEVSDCKRIDHKSVKFAKPWFKSYDCGVSHMICCDFEPKHPEYADFKEWKDFGNYWECYKKAWLPYGNTDTTLGFVLNNDNSIRYLVPMELFVFGGMIKEDKLMATEKMYDKANRKSPIGYTLVHEKINGVKI